MLQRVSAAATVVLSIGTVASAQGPSYHRIDLIARSSNSTSIGAFRVPVGADFGSQNAKINDARQVAAKAIGIGVDLDQAIFFGDAAGGSLKIMTIGGGTFSDGWANNTGTVVTSQTFGSSGNGLWRYEHSAMSGGFVSAAPIGGATWGSVFVNDSGLVAGQLNFGSSTNREYGTYDVAAMVFTRYVADATRDASSPYAFLATPSFNNANQIAALVRLGTATESGIASRPDQVRIFSADGSSVLIAEDRDSNPASNYLVFDNGIWLTDNGWVVFQASLATGGKGVFLSNGTTTRTIARTTAADPASPVVTIDVFRPSANAFGEVVFRGAEAGSVQAVWVGDGTNLRRIARRGDLLPVEPTLGTGNARIETTSGSIVFSGSPSINKYGDVAFIAQLLAETTNTSYGRGVYVAVRCRADADGNGLTEINDIFTFLNLWFAGSVGGDFDRNGSVTIDDIFQFLNAWFSGCP